MNSLPVSPPRRNNLSIIQRLIAAYKLWHEFLPHFPKTSRYTLGGKIDGLFTEMIELVFTASRLPGERKLPVIFEASAKLDSLKFFLQIAWEIKALDNKKYIALSENLSEIGRMLGGWQKQVNTIITPARGGEQK